ncbi:MAG: flagellar assembly protein FliH [Gammaproteobacteria bacterium]|nr:flagellar assembly protein FliH [Gammaproteobacteria bacterium]
MERHLFDGVGRVPLKDLATVPVENWMPPVIDKAGHLVQAHTREESARRDARGAAAPGATGAASEKSRDERVDEGYQEGLQKGRQEGIAEGRKSGFEQGQKDGIAQGEQQGLKRAQHQIDAKLAQLDELMLHIFHALNEQDYKLEQALLNLVTGVASAVIGRELEINSTHILQVVREALMALPPSRDNVRVFVNPADVALLEEARARNGDNWRALPDASVTAGGCRIETEQSLVDFTVESRFKAMLAQVLDKQLTGKPALLEVEPIEVAPEPLVPRLQDVADNDEEPESAGEPGLIDAMESLRAGVVPPELLVEMRED